MVGGGQEREQKETRIEKYLQLEMGEHGDELNVKGCVREDKDKNNHKNNS